jgi:hypothetical protein
MKVNSGKNIVVGTTNVVSVPVTYTVTHAADLDTSSDNFATGPLIYHGSSMDTADNVLISDDPATCTAASSTVLNVINIRPADGDLMNSDAGTWGAGALAVTSNGDQKEQDGLGTVKVQLLQADRQRRPRARLQGQDHHVHRQALPRQLGGQRLPRLHQPAGQAPVPQGGHQHVHHDQDGVLRPVRQPEGHRHRDVRRLLALQLRGHHDDPGGQRHG